MAGIYIHIPFCRQACHYCNFHFSTQKKGINDYVAALLNEISLRSQEWQNESIETIYLGGGTPSLLNNLQLDSIIKHVYKNYSIVKEPEITVECNPDDLSEDFIKPLLHTGVNRLSIGVQSFHDKHLELMNRSHNSTQAINSIQHAKKAGISNITIDLIYGLPELRLEEWEHNLNQVEQLGISHLSCYSLTIEERTALSHFVKSNKMKPADDDATIKQYELLLAWSKSVGIHQYEISNFARIGYESKHNSNYWQGKPYVGLGPSAHSYKDGVRTMNKANNAAYTKALLQHQLPETTSEVLTIVDQFNETIMLQLRIVSGLQQSALMKFPENFIHHFQKNILPFIHNGLVLFDNNAYHLSSEGQMLSDHVISSLFYSD